jgi:hypothetical protein
MPVQLPAQTPLPAHAARPPAGWPVVNRHVPAAPWSLQVSHEPSHAESQHTPSTQNPEAHAVALVHAAPRAAPPPPPDPSLPPVASALAGPSLPPVSAPGRSDPVSTPAPAPSPVTAGASLPASTPASELAAEPPHPRAAAAAIASATIPHRPARHPCCFACTAPQ